MDNNSTDELMSEPTTNERSQSLVFRGTRENIPPDIWIKATMRAEKRRVPSEQGPHDVIGNITPIFMTVSPPTTILSQWPLSSGLSSKASHPRLDCMILRQALFMLGQGLVLQILLHYPCMRKRGMSCGILLERKISSWGLIAWWLWT